MYMGEERDWTYGEEQAWHRLALSVPTEVCRRTGACFDEHSGAYILNVFNASIAIHPGHREIRGTGDLCNMLLGKLSPYSCLSILWYLAQAQVISPSGNFINPRELAGGLIFGRGSHALPLDKLAVKYGGDTAAFLKKGISLGGECSDYGDASIKLYPFPRVPVLLVLWREDEEFPANAVLLLDATCPRYLPTDIIWATAMVSVLVML
jgi:hypothetical protein